MKKYWRGINGQIVVSIKRLVRDKTAIFFTFLFPALLLIVFGFIYGNRTTNFDVAIINNSNSDFARRFVESAKNNDSGVLKFKNVEDIDDAKEKMKRSELNGIIELPPDFGAVSNTEQGATFPTGTLNVLYSKGKEQTGGALIAVMSRIINDINKGVGHPEPPLKVASVMVGDEALGSFDYALTGLLVFGLITGCLFGLANQMPAEKQKGNYRRLRAAPFTAGQLIIATSIVFTLVSLISTAIMIAVGILFFNFNMRGDWLLFILFFSLCAIMMTGFGLLIGAWAKNENQSSPLVNIVSQPMMFLSGIFIPTFLFPEWLKAFSQFIPITPAVEGVRLIMTENASFVDILPLFGGIILSIIILYSLAIKLFRWE